MNAMFQDEDDGVRDQHAVCSRAACEETFLVKGDIFLFRTRTKVGCDSFHSGLIYEEMRTVLKVFLENVIRDAVTCVWAGDYHQGKTADIFIP